MNAIHKIICDSINWLEQKHTKNLRAVYSIQRFPDNDIESTRRNTVNESINEMIVVDEWHFNRIVACLMSHGIPYYDTKQTKFISTNKFLCHRMRRTKHVILGQWHMACPFNWIVSSTTTSFISISYFVRQMVLIRSKCDSQHSAINPQRGVECWVTVITTMNEMEWKELRFAERDDDSYLPTIPTCTTSNAATITSILNTDAQR